LAEAELRVQLTLVFPALFKQTVVEEMQGVALSHSSRSYEGVGSCCSLYVSR